MPNSRKPLPAQLTRRQAIRLGGGAALGAAVGGGLAVPAHAARSNALDAILDAAADTHGVPRDLLAAIGFAETRLRNNDGPSQANGFGVMHLVSNPSHRTLHEAARLTGTAPSTLKSDNAANIDGAAAVLRAYADDAGLSGGDRLDIDTWYPVVARYSGASTPYVARLYADGVYDSLAAGFDKEGVEVVALGVDPNRVMVTDDVGILQATDYPSAHWIAAHSSNYTASNRPSSEPINYVICHIMQGTYAGTISWFQNPAANVTTHYCVRSSDGDITQMVRHKDIGWHAGNWSYNQQSIGIEHEGWFNEPHWYTEIMYRSSADLTRFICDQYGIPKNRSRVLRHGEASSTPCPGPIWDFDRYMSYVNDDNGGGEPIWDVVVDATSADFSAPSSWQQSSWNSQKYGDFYRYNTPEAISEVAWYAADLPENGSYRVDVWYPSDSGYSNAAPHHVVTSSGNQVVNVDQRSGGGQWQTIGTFSMNAGRRNVVGVSRWTGASGYIIADAVRISLLG